jgi:hypothetical protein
MPGSFHFDGFSAPNYTQVPDELFDVLAPNLTEAELRVLLYIVRRTFGFKKQADAISLSLLTEGISTTDGRVLDQGTGMSRKGVSAGVKGLVEKGVLLVDRATSPDGGHQVNVYRLRFREEGIVTLGNHPGYPRSQGVVTAGNPQQTVVQQTEEQETVSNFEISNGPDPSTNSRRSLNELAKADEEWNRFQARIKRLRAGDKM